MTQRATNIIHAWLTQEGKKEKPRTDRQECAVREMLNKERMRARKQEVWKEEM